MKIQYGLGKQRLSYYSSWKPTRQQYNFNEADFLSDLYHDPSHISRFDTAAYMLDEMWTGRPRLRGWGRLSKRSEINLENYVLPNSIHPPLP